MAVNPNHPIRQSPNHLIKFGTDGWRGIIAEDFTFENVKIVAQALTDYLIQPSAISHQPSVVVGYDTRFLSDKFAEVFAKVLLANGVKAKLTAGVVSTPALSFTVKNYNFDFGVMFSASHNPAKYDGIKFRASYGGPASVEVSKKIESYLGQNSPRFNEKVTVEKIDPLKGYLAYLRSRIDFDLLKKLRAKIVLDPLYGCGSGYLEEILKNVVRCPYIVIRSIHSERDPLFGGLQPEQVEHNLGELKKVVKKEKAFLGLAFDGDADRLGVVTDKGQYLTPHQVFPLLLDYLAKEKGWSGKVVQTVSLGYLSKRIAQKYGLPFEEVPVGFKYITEKMLKEDILIGGEESGGYGFRGGLPERDGVLSGLLFLEMLAYTKKKPSELVVKLEKNFGKSYFLREDLRLAEDSKIQRFKDLKINELMNLTIWKSANLKISKILTIDGIKIIFSDDSWLLLRPSGTEPLFRLYAETASVEKTKKLLAFAKKMIYNVCPK
jgi:phosphomannomutase